MILENRLVYRLCRLRDLLEAEKDDVEAELTRYANRAFDEFLPLYYKGRAGDRTRKDIALDVLFGTLSMAKRKGITQKEVLGWLQRAYGSIWVRRMDFNPEVDMKDLTRLTKKHLRT